MIQLTETEKNNVVWPENGHVGDVDFTSLQ